MNNGKQPRVELLQAEVELEIIIDVGVGVDAPVQFSLPTIVAILKLVRVSCRMRQK